MMKSKKGFTVQDMLPLGITIVVLGVGLSLGLTILSDFQTSDPTIGTTANCGLNSTGGTEGTISYSNCGADYNGTGQAVTGLVKFTTYLPTIALVIVIAVIIGILVNYLVRN